MHEKQVSRREFLKLAGIAGASLGVVGALGGVVAACGGTTTTTSAPATSTTAAATGTTAAAVTTTGASSTTVSASSEAGRAIKIGIVAPATGNMAVLGSGDQWANKLVSTAIGDGVVCGDGKKHPVEFLLRDSQSDANRAGQVAGDLINNDKVDIIMAGGGPDTGNPPADQAEAYGTPYIGAQNVWEAFVMGRGYDPAGKKPMKWTYGILLGAEQLHYGMMDVINQFPNNKKVAFLAMNNADGQAQIDANTGAPMVYKQYGYELVSAGLYTPGAEDFTEQIALFKKAGCDVLSGAVSAPDFTNFWKQSLQQGFHPAVPSMALALDYPQVIEALGTSGLNLIAELPWHPSFPFKDWITGKTCQELADDFEQVTGGQWNSNIGALAKHEWALDALKRTANVDDKEAILKAITETKIETVMGPLDMTAPLDQNPLGKTSFRPHPNVYKMCYSGGQWVKGTGKRAVDINVCANPCWPSSVTPPAATKPVAFTY